MTAAAVRCTRCGADCDIPPGDGWIRKECPACREKLRLYAFPALFRPQLRRPRPHLALEGQASCYFHSDKRAAVPCDGCGRFLCGLCDLEFQGRHFCGACLSDARRQLRGAAPEAGELLRVRVFLPHNLAWALACYSPMTLVGLYLMPLTAPAALWFALRHWNRVDGLQIRGRWRAVAAVFVAALQIGIMAGFASLIAFGLREMARR